MILILTEDFDPHADHVAARLAARGAPFVRFNPAAFPTHASISLAYTRAASPTPPSTSRTTRNPST